MSKQCDYEELLEMNEFQTGYLIVDCYEDSPMLLRIQNYHIEDEFDLPASSRGNIPQLVCDAHEAVGKRPNIWVDTQSLISSSESCNNGYLTNFLGNGVLDSNCYDEDDEDDKDGWESLQEYFFDK